METNDPKQGGTEEPAAQRRDEEATSSETLSDIERSEKVSTGAGSTSSSGELEGSTPSPDAGGGGGGRADGSDTGGPM